MAAATAARRLEGRPRAAGDDLRAVELPRQHRRGADRRHDRRRRVPRQGAHRLSRRDRRRVQRRRLGQRRRRHDDDDDVDRRRAIRCRWSRPTSPPARRCCVFGIPAAIQQQRYSPITQRRAGRRRRRLGARVHRRADPGRGDRRQRRRQRSLSTRSPDAFPFIGAAVWVALLVCVPLRRPGLERAAGRDSRAASSCCRWCSPRR